MAFLGGLLKTKEEREMDRQITILNSVSKQKQLIKKLQKHEREYMKKAVQAKRQKDMINFKRLCSMVAQTIVQRRNMESQLLFFETLQQTCEKVQIFKEYALGLKSMTRTISDIYKDFNSGELMREINIIMTQSTTMQTGMNAVMERISTASDSMLDEDQTDGIKLSEIEQTVSSLADAEDESSGLDSSIDEKINQIEDELQKQAKETS